MLSVSILVDEIQRKLKTRPISDLAVQRDALMPVVKPSFDSPALTLKRELRLGKPREGCVTAAGTNFGPRCMRKVQSNSSTVGRFCGAL
jgi:hypothetical protein